MHIEETNRQNRHKIADSYGMRDSLSNEFHIIVFQQLVGTNRENVLVCELFPGLAFSSQAPPIC